MVIHNSKQSCSQFISLKYLNIASKSSKMLDEAKKYIFFLKVLNLMIDIHGNIR